MDAVNAGPQTLQQAIIHFSDIDVCQAALVAARWKDGIACPTCGSQKVGYIKTRRIWECRAPEKHTKRQFSAKVGTIFEDSPLGLDKWFVVIWMLANCKNGVSSYEIKRAIGVQQRTGWFMLSRVRLAMQRQSFMKFDGEVEVDETFIGGRARFMHFGRRKRLGDGRGAIGKVAVMGLLQRHGRNRSDDPSEIRLAVVPNTRRRNLQQHLRKNVVMDGETTLYTDALKSYDPKTPKGWRPSDLYIHKVIDHAETYVDGAIHTNGCENFWSLLKRSLKGTYVSVEAFHLFRYLDEQAFRFNTRKTSDAKRFANVLDTVVGRRLTYAELTAAESH